MPTIAAQLDRIFRDAIRAAFGLDADPLSAVAQNEKFGDYQSNAAMGLAKTVADAPARRPIPAPSPSRSRQISTSATSWRDRPSPAPGSSMSCSHLPSSPPSLAAAGNDPSRRLGIAQTAAPQTRRRRLFRPEHR